METAVEKESLSQETHDHFSGAAWALETVIAHLMLIEDRDVEALRGDTILTIDELRSVRCFLENCRKHPVRKPVYPF